MRADFRLHFLCLGFGRASSLNPVSTIAVRLALDHVLPVLHLCFSTPQLTMLKPRSNLAKTALRTFSALPHLHLQHASRVPLPRPSLSKCAPRTFNLLTSSSNALSQRSTHTSSFQSPWRPSAGKLDERPGLERGTSELLRRGMKVRASVKKLCEGCKVGAVPLRIAF